MTFTSRPCAASTTARMSASTYASSPEIKRAMFSTMSISSAPAAISSSVSAAFVFVVWLPCGNPTTVEMRMSEPATSSAAHATSAGRTVAEATSWRSASSTPSRTVARSSSGRSNEWSIVFATSRYSRVSIPIMLRRYVNDSAAHDVVGSYPLPGWLEHAARRLDDFGPDDRRRRSRCVRRQVPAPRTSRTVCSGAGSASPCRREIQPRPQLGDERPVARGARQQDLRRAEEQSMRAQRGRELLDEGRLVERLEGVLPPEAEHAERPGLALDPRLDPTDEAVAPEQRQDVVAPAPLRGRDVDLPEIVEVPQAAQQVAIPHERVEWSEERHSRDDRPLVKEQRRFLRQDHAVTLDALDRNGQQQAVLDQLVAQPVPLGRGRRGAEPDLLIAAAHPKQPVGAVPREELVLPLLLLRPPLGEEVGREEPLGEVVQAPVAVAAGNPEHARQRQRLEDRAHLVRRAPVPVDRLTHLDVLGRQRPLLPDPLEQLGDELGVVVELAVPVRRRIAVPADPVVRQLRRRQQRETLVVGLVQPALAVEQVVRPLAAVAVDAGGEDEVVVASGDVERVELERAEPADNGLHRLRRGRQRAWRREQVAADEEATRSRAVHGRRV